MIGMQLTQVPKQLILKDFVKTFEIFFHGMNVLQKIHTCLFLSVVGCEAKDVHNVKQITMTRIKSYLWKLKDRLFNFLQLCEK